MHKKLIFLAIILFLSFYFNSCSADTQKVLSCLNGSNEIKIKSCPEAIENTTINHFYHKKFYKSLGKSLDDSNRFKESIQVYQKALIIYPENNYFLKHLSLAKSNLIEHVWMKNRNKKANQKNTKSASSSRAVNEKLDKLRCKRLSGIKALKACNNALKVSPDDAVLHAAKGDILLDLGKTDEAIKAYKKSLQILPTDKITAIKLDRLDK
jgi:tetratricopeptide (TPR) repeat protein